jgi:GntR family galactonate operon transcriptional repressor
MMFGRQPEILMDRKRTPVPRATFQAQVADRLGREIGAGIFRPGQALPSEPELGARFGYSRIVIREAIKSLAAKGLIEVGRRTGTVVLDPLRWNLFDPDVMAWRARSTDPVMTRDLMELRRIVEPAAARLAAEKASDEQRRALRAAYTTMARAVAGEGDYVQADLAFHTIVLTACGNQYVRQMQEAMSANLRASFEIVSKTPGGPAHSLPMHEAICAAIERQDGAAAERATLALIAQADIDLQDRLRTPVAKAPRARRAITREPAR